MEVGYRNTLSVVFPRSVLFFLKGTGWSFRLADVCEGVLNVVPDANGLLVVPVDSCVESPDSSGEVTCGECLLSVASAGTFSPLVGKDE